MKNSQITILWIAALFWLSIFFIFYPKQTINHFKWRGENDIEHFISFYFYCLVALIIGLPGIIWWSEM